MPLRRLLGRDVQRAIRIDRREDLRGIEPGNEGDDVRRLARLVPALLHCKLPACDGPRRIAFFGLLHVPRAFRNLGVRQACRVRGGACPGTDQQ